MCTARADSLDRHLNDLMISRQQLPYDAAFRAGRALLRYRRAGGARSALVTPQDTAGPAPAALRYDGRHVDGLANKA